MATLFLIFYALFLLCKDLVCNNTKTPKAETKPICDFSQEDITYFEELIDLDND